MDRQFQEKQAAFNVSTLKDKLLAWESLAEREQKWAAFGADPEWIAKRNESHKDGEIVERISSQLLTPTAFSSVK